MRLASRASNSAAIGLRSISASASERFASAGGEPLPLAVEPVCQGEIGLFDNCQRVQQNGLALVVVVGRGDATVLAPQPTAFWNRPSGM